MANLPHPSLPPTSFHVFPTPPVTEETGHVHLFGGSSSHLGKAPNPTGIQFTAHP